MMKMSPQDYHVFHVGDDGLHAAAHFRGMTSEWPATIVHYQKKYNFETQEVMEDWMVGSFAGHAKYTLVDN